MNISPEVFNKILTPTAAYAAPIPTTSRVPADSVSPQDAESPIDPLKVSSDSHWDFQGIEFTGTRYFILPSFAFGKPPLRIDVFIPPLDSIPKHLQDKLQVNLSLRSQSKHKASALGISKHILAAVSWWSLGVVNFETKYTSLPFGSRIIVENIEQDVSEMSIQLIPVYDTERSWLTVSQLKVEWNLADDIWPDELPWEDLALCRQFHEAISVVQIPKLHSSRLFVFKSLTRDTHYMYHELWALLNAPQSPHIVPKSLYLITKKARFGRKKGVCGFIIPYYPSGTLHDWFDNESHVQATTLQDRYRWAAQITAALQAITKSPLRYYPDLKPDNVILFKDGEKDTMNALLIDLEQRGGWYSWTPRDVSYIEFVEYIACSKPPLVSQTHVDECINLMVKWKPDWQSPVSFRYEGKAAPQGLSTAWASKTTRECESAQVYMLGKLLWCIFESRSSINCALSPDTLRETCPEHEFPTFVQTPPNVRHLIRMCTAGAAEWNGTRRPIRLDGNSLVLHPDYSALHPDGCGPQAVQEVATKWWHDQVESAKAYLKYKTNVQNSSNQQQESNIPGSKSNLMDTLIDNPDKYIQQRPTLDEVYKQLVEVAKELHLEPLSKKHQRIPFLNRP